jgi:hypothetical protein
VNPIWVGLTFWHAYVVLGPGFSSIAMASNARPVAPLARVAEVAVGDLAHRCRTRPCREGGAGQMAAGYKGRPGMAAGSGSR